MMSELTEPGLEHLQSGVTTTPDELMDDLEKTIAWNRARMRAEGIPDPFDELWAMSCGLRWY